MVKILIRLLLALILSGLWQPRAFAEDIKCVSQEDMVISNEIVDLMFKKGIG